VTKKIDRPKEEEPMKEYVEAAAQAIGLPLDEAHLPGVVLHMERLAAMAALVAEFPLEEEAEPAPVYRP
jgi:hypothetical protein